VNPLDEKKTEETPVFQERLQKEGREDLKNGIRFLLILACFIYPSFYGLDLITSQEHHFFFLKLRLLVVFHYLIGIALLSSKYGTKIAVPLSIVEVYLTNLAISIMTVYIGGFESNYYVGIVFVIFVSGLFLTLSVPETLVNGLLTLVSYFLINGFFAPPAFVTLAKAAPPFFFLSGAVAFTIFATLSREKSRRRDLKLRMEIEKANEELKELDQAKMRFFSNVSHELRSPLTLILGPLETLLMKKQDTPDTLHLLRAMEGNARRLLRQVNTLLDFAKLDAGKIECHYESSNLNWILQGLADAARPHLMNRNIDLVVAGLDNFPDTYLDPEKVETVAANLLSNAIKFTPEGGRITIRAAEEEEEFIWFEVEDTGIGIPEEKLDDVFERFTQVDDKMSRRQEGTGLGLAMVKQLVKVHAGRVTVRSTLGKGSTFRVELPKQPDSRVLERRRNIGRRREDQISYARTLAMINTPSETTPDNKTKTLLADVIRNHFGESQDDAQKLQNRAPSDAPKVLIVEDNPDLRFFVASNLADDYRIEMAQDGIEGLETARRWIPDLIISDIMMPRMDGHEFTRQIKKDPSLSQVPVILATAKSGGRAVEEGLEVGANDYLAKPFEIRELKARVAAQLRTHRLEKNLNERDSRLAAIGQMTSAIVHDLKNPLSSIIGFAQIAKEDVLTGGATEMVIQELEPVISEAHRLSRMIEEVLDFAKGTSSDLNLVATELDIYLLTLCQPIKQKLATMGIELVLKQEVEGNLFIQIDNDRLIRVFENLIRNAQEAIWSDEQHPRGKHIWITIGGDQESVTVRIADDGPGIPEGMEKNLFEAYITGKKKTGSGLGLATARNLVKAHGGEISVEPRGPEGGAVFLLSFPRTTNG